MNATPKFSIITVVKDDAEGFAGSLESLLAQTFQDLELIVIDSSADQSSIPDQLQSIHDAARIVVKYQWCPPTGIYPAMNLGLSAAQGEFAYFLNAGDQLKDPQVLARVAQKLSDRTATWLFGPIEIVDLARGTSTITPTWNYHREQQQHFARGFFPSHQGTFSSVRALRDLGGFDPQFVISADYALFLKLSLLSDPIIVDFPIAQFMTGGASTDKWRESFAEFHTARCLILKPSGLDAVREKFWTQWHFSRVWIYRELIARARR